MLAVAAGKEAHVAICRQEPRGSRQRDVPDVGQRGSSWYVAAVGVHGRHAAAKETTPKKTESLTNSVRPSSRRGNFS